MINQKGQFIKGNPAWNKGKEGLFVSPRKGKKCPEISERLKGHKVSEETRKKISLIHKNKVIRLETRKRMSESHMGMKAWNKGIKIPERSGKNSNFWKGGITPINIAIRQSLDYKLWREAVFKRDDFTCKECGIRGKELHPHHIKPFSLFPELRFAIDNGVTLCAKCHRKTDTYGGRVHKYKKELVA